jgi:sortase A
VLRPATPEARSTPQPVDQSVTTVRPIAGALLGRIEIPRLNLSAMVREGVDAATLSRAVGHVPSTSLAGDRGNFAIAAHRDTLFRGLKDIRSGDTVIFETSLQRYSYQVFSTRIVRPSEVSVLRPDGGFSSSVNGHLTEVADRPSRLLTMITCYPFYYVGSAPQRFIVQARLVSSAARESQPD